jgi:signal transduction histidine kinase
MCANALLEDPAPSRENLEYLLGTVTRSAEWMHRIIQDLLDVTGIEAGRLSLRRERVSVERVVEAAREMFAPQAAEKGIALEVRADDALPAMHADRERVLQVLVNLLGNALKFTESGRVALDVTADAGDAPESAPPGAAGGEARWARFTVRDTGPGIPPEHLAHIFDRYWQAARGRRGSAGLGLAISRGIVQAHGGEIRVESAVGRGSAFTFWIPVAAAAEEAVGAEGDAGAALSAGAARPERNPPASRS